MSVPGVTVYDLRVGLLEPPKGSHPCSGGLGSAVREGAHRGPKEAHVRGEARGEREKRKLRNDGEGKGGELHDDDDVVAKSVLAVYGIVLVEWLMEMFIVLYLTSPLIGYGQNILLPNYLNFGR